MIGRLIINTLVLVRATLEWVLLWPVVLLRLRKRHFVSIELKGRFRLSARRGLFRRGKNSTYATFDDLLEAIGRSRRIEGVILRLRGLEISLADAFVLRSRLAEFRGRGKRVIVHFDAARASDMVLSSAADSVMMSPAGQITLLGLNVELFFLRNLLRRLGVRAQFLHIGKYKTAANMFVRGAPSEAQRAETNRLLTQSTTLLASLLTRDGLVSESHASWPFGRPMYDVSQARIAGLVDHQAYPEQVIKRLRAERSPEPFDPLATFGDVDQGQEITDRLETLPAVWVQSEAQHRRSRPRPVRLRPFLRGPRTIVTVELSGLIVDDQAEGALAGRSQRITPAAVRKVFRGLRSSSRVAGVVLAIDSRGGSAVASDLVWHEVRRLAAKKPVVAFLRSVAASGGYYIAVGAHEIVASPLTITGSIGVILGKFSVDQTLEKAGIHSQSFPSSPFSTLFSVQRPFDKVQLETLRNDIRSAYKRFVSRVTVGRGMSRSDVHQLGRGRIFTGDAALAAGLVDTIGSLEDAINRVADRAGVSRQRVSVSYRRLEDRGVLAALGGRGEALSSLPQQWIDAAQFCALMTSNPILAYCDVALRGA